MFSVWQRPGKGGGGWVAGLEWGRAEGGGGDQIKKSFNYLEHIPDLKCALDSERVLDNKNVFLILNVAVKSSLLRSVPLQTFLRTRSMRSFFFGTMGSFLISPFLK